jgi:hypothetical protein
VEWTPVPYEEPVRARVAKPTASTDRLVIVVARPDENKNGSTSAAQELR